MFIASRLCHGPARVLNRASHASLSSPFPRQLFSLSKNASKQPKSLFSSFSSFSRDTLVQRVLSSPQKQAKPIIDNVITLFKSALTKHGTRLALFAPLGMPIYYSSAATILPSSSASSVSELSPDKRVVKTSKRKTAQAVEEREENTTSIWKLFFESPFDVFLYLASSLCTMSSALLSVYVPKLVGAILDSFDKGTFTLSLEANNPAFHLLLLFGAQALLKIVSFSLLSFSTEHFCQRIKTALFKRLITLEIDFYDQSKTGELVTRLSGDIAQVRGMAKHSISRGLRSVCAFTGGIASLFNISPKLTGIMMLVVPLVVTIGSGYGMVLRRLSNQIHKDEARASAMAAECFSNIRTVRSCANEEWENERHATQTQKVHQNASKLGSLIGAFHALSSLSLSGVVMLTLYVGERLITNGDISGGQLASFMMHAMRLQSSLAQLSLLFGEISKGVAASARIDDILNLKAKIKIKGGIRPDIHQVEGRIVFDNVFFRYASRDDVPVFEGLSITLEPNTVTALVGPSGSGKSTFASLLEGFYQPLEGQILLDGNNLSSLDPSWLRSVCVAMVEQEPVLFSGTIEDNIRYGRPSATKEQVIQAAKIANCHQFIEDFPKGYATELGERGISLSGGQKQRVAIARAVLKDPRILILDEATSALDSKSERLVQEALDRLMEGRTTLIIAHRLSTIQDADKIAVIQHGRVAEEGKHSDLMGKTNGLYKKLVEYQLQDNEIHQWNK